MTCSENRITHFKQCCAPGCCPRYQVLKAAWGWRDKVLNIWAWRWLSCQRSIPRSQPQRKSNLKDRARSLDIVIHLRALWTPRQEDFPPGDFGRCSFPGKADLNWFFFPKSGLNFSPSSPPTTVHPRNVLLVSAHVLNEQL